MKNILVLCTGNSCRSQIAQGWLNYFTYSSKIQIYSAGIEAHGLNKMAVETMSEIGIDISHQKSNLISDYDKIIVIKKGRIVEEGTHNELINNNKDYYKYYELQKMKNN